MNEISVCTIEYGDDSTRLGALGPVNDDWSPLFFSVIGDGSIAVPDFYKNRIAIFTQNGDYVREIKLEGILSPRMSHFAGAKTDRFIVFNDSVLFCLADDGSVVWNVPFPTGIIPQSIYANETGVSFSVIDSTGDLSGISISNDPPFGTTDATFRDGKAIVPFIVFGSYKYGYTLGDSMKIKPLKTGSLPGTARFMAADENGNSLWLSEDNEVLKLYVLSETGKSIFTAKVTLKDSSTRLWSVAELQDKVVTLFVHEQGLGGMEIRGYQGKIK